MASVEGGVKIATGKLIKLSEQEVIDFWSARDSLVKHCGGLSGFTFEYLIKMKGRISKKVDYPYRKKIRKWKRPDKTKTVDTGVWGYIQIPNDPVALLVATASQPVTVSLSTDKKFDIYDGVNILYKLYKLFKFS